MELAQLRTFVLIAECGSFRRAAEQLHMAQPSLSLQIRRLETELGVQVFDRSRRPVSLTEPGRVLLARAESILTSVEETIAELRDFDAHYQGKVAIGAMQYLAHLELPHVLARFRSKCPDAELHLRIGNTAEVRKLLVSGEIDVALIHGDGNPLPDNFAIRPLRTERLVLITARDHPLVNAGHSSWGDLSGESFILFREGASLRDALLDVCSRAGFVPHATLETAEIATAVSLVEQGLGVALVPASFARQEAKRVAAMHVGSTDITRSVTLAWNKRAYQSRALATFKTLAAEFFTS